MKTIIMPVIAASLLLVTGCATQRPLSKDFGNATEQNKAVHIANPEVSNEAPTYDGAHTANAVAKYRTGQVEEVQVETTSQQ
jgi:type IV pilus biogenesis protein CpaD/CtpE